jgi:hypothetical protein
MSMSRKDYESAAEIIANSWKYARYETPVRKAAKEATLREVMEGLASMFGRDNGRFDRDKFKTACGFGTVPTAGKHNIEKGDSLYYFGERVKVVAVVDRKTIKITELFQGRHYGEPFDVSLSDLNY